MFMKKPATSFADARGEIVDLIESEEINAVTIVTFKKGAVRGNHFHKETTQWNYVISGRLALHTELPPDVRREVEVVTGDLVMLVPNERHAFVALEDTMLAVFTKGPRGGKEYEIDTFRIEPPLVDPTRKQDSLR